MTEYRNKGILVIGGGILQQATFELCKKLSITTFLVDRDSNCYSKEYADHFIHIQNCAAATHQPCEVFNIRSCL